MRTLLSIVALLCALCPGARAAPAPAPVTLMLNWTPNAEHAPFYYALAQGWYRRAGLALTIEAGRGSQAAVQQAGLGRAQFAVADLPTALVGRGNGSRVHAVMAIYQNSAHAFYWLERSGIAGPRDFAGRLIGNPPGDAARLMWPLYARAVGVAPQSVRFANIGTQGKMSALQSGAVDIITDYVLSHDIKTSYFGRSLRYATWRDAGLNLYGNALLVNDDFLRAHRALVAGFVRITQLAYRRCAQDAQPCLAALSEQVSGLKYSDLVRQWARVAALLRGPAGAPLGAFVPARLQADYQAVRSTVGIGQPFDVREVATNAFLDDAVKLAP